MNALEILIGHAQGNERYINSLPSDICREYLLLLGQASAEYTAIRDELSIKTLENLKGQSVLRDKQAEIEMLRAALAKCEAAINHACEVGDSEWSVYSDFREASEAIKAVSNA